MAKNSAKDAYEVPRKRQIRWTLVIVTLFFLGLLVDYLFLHLVFKDKTSQSRTAQPAPTEITAPATPGAEAAPTPRLPPPPPDEQGTPPPAASAPTALDIQKFHQEIAKCYGSENPLAAANTSEQFMKQFLAVNPTVKSQLEVENTHIQLKDGSMRRLHLIPADETNGQKQELRYFSLDAEGLPVLIPLPDKDRLNPKPEFINSLTSQGKVVFHQVKENRALKDGSRLSLNTINDRVFEFQHFGKDKSFSCRDLDCRCQ